MYIELIRTWNNQGIDVFLIVGADETVLTEGKAMEIGMIQIAPAVRILLIFFSIAFVSPTSPPNYTHVYTHRHTQTHTDTLEVIQHTPDTPYIPVY